MRKNWMKNLRSVLVAVLATASVLGCGRRESEGRFTAVGEAQTIRGTVVDTELTLCAPVEGKPGTCEGTMVLEPAGGGEADRITLEITRDVALKKEGRTVLLPQLQGSVVDARYVATREGPKLATSVVAVP